MFIPQLANQASFRYDDHMHPVVQLIHRRIQGKKDNAVLSLVIGGGAMRGAIAGGMLTVLEESGASDIFDHIYGASAGATNGAIFLAHQCRQLLPVFLERLTRRRFTPHFSSVRKSAGFIRMTRRGLYVDVPLVYQKLLKHEMPLHTGRILTHRTMLHIAATDADTGACCWFTPLSAGEAGKPMVTEFTNRDSTDVLTVLHASAAMPAFYNKPVTIRHRRYLDGGVTEPLAVAQAIRDGATHVLVLSTVPETYRAVNRHPLVERWARRRIKKFGEGFRRVYDERYHAFNRSLDLAFGRTFLPQGVSVLTLAPYTLIGWAERNKKILMRAVEEGAREMRKALE